MTYDSGHYTKIATDGNWQCPFCHKVLPAGADHLCYVIDTPPVDLRVTETERRLGQIAETLTEMSKTLTEMKRLLALIKEYSR